MQGGVRMEEWELSEAIIFYRVVRKGSLMRLSEHVTAWNTWTPPTLNLMLVLSFALFHFTLLFSKYSPNTHCMEQTELGVAVA